MTFDDYMRAVIDYFMIGGVSWETSYMRTLKANRGDLYDQIRGERGYDLTETPANLSAFLYFVFENWEK